MPLQIKWSNFNKDNVSRESDNYGVFEIGNDSGVLYIGEGHIHSRLISHFPQGTEPVVGASYYRVEYTGGKERCEQRKSAELDAHYKNNGSYPKFNTGKK